MSYIISIDQGTTGTTACLIDSKNFSFLGKVNCEFKQIYPGPGEVEHNLLDIWASVSQTIQQLLAKFDINSKHIEAIGITNQRETTCAFDFDGVPLANAIVWQDRRTSSYCNDLLNDGCLDTVISKTGLKLDPYFSASKMRWLLQNNKKVVDAAKQKNLRLGTIDTFLLYKLSGHKSFKTEVSNASRTMLMNLKSRQWDDDLLKLFGIKKDFLPEICDSFSKFAVTKNLDFLPDGIPITGILGDQQSALFGQKGTDEGAMKCTYGTGAFMLLNTGKNIVYSDNGLLTTLAYQYKNNPIYALEGSCYIAGAAVQWLRDNLKFFPKSEDIEYFANQVTDLNQMKYLMFMPFFTGVGSPYWNAELKGTITGLTRDTNQFQLSLACLDGIALSINDLINAMEKDLGKKIDFLNVDGGASMNTRLLKIQATVSKLKIIRPQVIETTAYGAALAAGIGQGIININEIGHLWKEDQQFSIQPDWSDHYSQKVKNWRSWCKKHC